MARIPAIIPPNAKFQPQDPEYVSNDTTSKDPEIMKKRIFCGCLQESCAREDVIELFSMYGPLHGVTHFQRQGFAFVQFENEYEAVDAVNNLNNYYFQDSCLEVKIATPRENFMKNTPKPLPLGQPVPIRKRGGRKEREKRLRKQLFDEGKDPDEVERIVAERRASDEQEKVEKDRMDNDRFRNSLYQNYPPYRPIPQQHKEYKKIEPRTTAQVRKLTHDEVRQQVVEQEDSTQGDASWHHEQQNESKNGDEEKNKPKEEPIPTSLNENEIPDVLICGGCHLITANAQFFLEHRLNPCDRQFVVKGEDEPETLKCYQCKLNCKNSWDLINHMGRVHKLSLFNKNKAKTIENCEDS